MSYDIYIGNAELESDWPGDDWGGPHAECVVPFTTHEDAPYKPDMTGKGNSCHPGYSQWSNAMESVGLSDVFFAEDGGLLAQHPGIKVLTREHLQRFEQAREDYRRQHPNERPGCCQCNECQVFPKPDAPPHDPSLNFNMMRLDWLCFWAKWALDNCERPSVYNR